MSRRLTPVVAAALVAAAIAAPAASAMPDFAVNGSAPVPERTTDHEAVSPARAVAPVPERITDRPAGVPIPGPTVVVEADEGSAFDWGSAAIGAGLVLALALLSVAAITATTRHGGLRPSH